MRGCELPQLEVEAKQEAQQAVAAVQKAGDMLLFQLKKVAWDIMKSKSSGVGIHQKRL